MEAKALIVLGITVTVGWVWLYAHDDRWWWLLFVGLGLTFWGVIISD